MATGLENAKGQSGWDQTGGTGGTGAAYGAGTFNNPAGTAGTLTYATFENNYVDYETCLGQYNCATTGRTSTTYQTECNLCDAINVIGNHIQNDPEYEATKTKYANLTNKRNDLDLKLQGLYNIDNSIPDLYQLQNDSTVYTGVLWTVLATTLIYYVFIKL